VNVTFEIMELRSGTIKHNQRYCSYSKCNYVFNENEIGFEGGACTAHHGILADAENGKIIKDKCDKCGIELWAGDMKDHYPDGLFCQDCWNPNWKDWNQMYSN